MIDWRELPGILFKSLSMFVAGAMVIVSLFSGSLIYPPQSINGQTFESTSTQWAVYTNDMFSFSVEYPHSGIISEKQNRFESGGEAAIELSDLGENYGSFNFADAMPSTTSNIRVLTNLAIKEVIGGFDSDYEKRLIESTSSME